MVVVITMEEKLGLLNMDNATDQLDWEESEHCHISWDSKHQ